MSRLLKRIATDYIAIEDRIRIRGEVGESEMLAVWLTQRILRGLVPILVKRLEGLTRTSAQPEIVQSYMQQAAKAALQPQPAMKVEPDGETWLPSTVEISQSETAVRFTFRRTDGESAQLILNSDQVRQWLSVLHRTWGKTGWPADVWPAWIKQPEQPEQRPATLH